MIVFYFARGDKPSGCQSLNYMRGEREREREREREGGREGEGERESEREIVSKTNVMVLLNVLRLDV